MPWIYSRLPLGRSAVTVPHVTAAPPGCRTTERNGVTGGDPVRRHVPDDPDPNEPARGYPEPREWQLTAGEAPDTFTIGVPGTELRLAQSPLRIFPPFVALTPPFIPEYQTWTFRSVE